MEWKKWVAWKACYPLCKLMKIHKTKLYICYGYICKVLRKGVEG